MNQIAPTIPKHLMREETQETKAKNTLAKDDFLKLLMTQLQHQDPVNPMDHQQFATQLAQFSSLEQLTNIGKGIDGLKGNTADEGKLQALGLIGKEVRASGSRVDLQPGQEASLKYLPDAEATPVKATVYDAVGTLVREIDLVTEKQRQGDVVWDGKDSQGSQAAPGKYSFRVHGVDRNGQSKELSAEVSGKVIGVETVGDQPLLVVDNGSGTSRVEIGKISRVSLPESKETVAAPKVQQPDLAAVLKDQAAQTLLDGGEAGDGMEDSLFDSGGRNHIGDMMGRFGR